MHDIRIARRQTQGVTVFRVAEGEAVVAVAHMNDLGDDGDAGEGDGAEGEAEPAPDNGGK